MTRLEYEVSRMIRKDLLKGRITPDRCKCCLKFPTPEGHDACIGTLPEDIVMNACCGHGEESKAYVQLWEDRDNPLRGEVAIEFIQKAKAHNKITTTESDDGYD